MHELYQIEDLISQDATGVLFRAIDTQSGIPVALRRFFPFGASGGGLKKEDQTAYKIAIERLSAVTHPALRGVISGDCDPVDGMPFIATEWIEGTPLETFVQKAPLQADMAVNVLMQALEVSELISVVLEEEAIWVDTNLQSIIVADQGSGRNFTFWLSPYKWVGGKFSHRGLKPLVNLTEKIMGWEKQMVSDQAGHGLGGWLKWLRKAPFTTTLSEAREKLIESIRTEKPQPSPVIAPQKIQSSAPMPTKIVLAIWLGVALVLTGIGSWVFTRQHSLQEQPQPQVSAQPSPTTPATEAPKTEIAPTEAPRTETAATEAPTAEPPATAPTATEIAATPAPRGPTKAEQRAAELHAQLLEEEKKKEAILAKQKAAVTKRSGIFSPKDSELIASKKGQIVTVEGRIQQITTSQSKLTNYLYFSKKPTPVEVRGTMAVKDVAAVGKKFAKGKKVQITGKVHISSGRPQIKIADPKDLKVID